MNDWHTYRNGSPRQPWDLERLARHRAAKLGYRVHRSRRRKGPDNAGNLMLIHKASSTVLLGAGYSNPGNDPRVLGTGADAISAVFTKASGGRLASLDVPLSVRVALMLNAWHGRAPRAAVGSDG